MFSFEYQFNTYGSQRILAKCTKNLKKILKKIPKTRSIQHRALESRDVRSWPWLLLLWPWPWPKKLRGMLAALALVLSLNVMALALYLWPFNIPT